ncbi:hypothetical protein Hamer_G022385 [Homarus americanus]|uniref:Uncharacterized protein n=1 Tax=Homarus americanus TaxID=6706 RepID=A0A8J5JY93_HOMAM|nr:hypothetical protein Hamer_G022385 [Homarus americanus]
MALYKMLFVTVIFASFTSISLSQNDTDTSQTTNPTPNNGNNQTEGTQNPEEERYVDVTDFVHGVNGWDFMGWWAKYDLLRFKEGKRPVPTVPESNEQNVFICQVSKYPSLLEKKFPALKDSKLQLLYFIACEDDDHDDHGDHDDDDDDHDDDDDDHDDKDFLITGEVVGAEEMRYTAFNYTYRDDLAEQNGMWVTQDFTLDNVTSEGNFSVRLEVQGSKKMVWAVAMMKVMGVMVAPPTPVIPTTPPTVNVSESVTTSQPNTTENATHQANTTQVPTDSPIVNQNNGSTTTPTPSVNGTTLPTNGTNNGTNNGTDNGTHAGVFVTTEKPIGTGTEAEIGKLANVAQAIWDAFLCVLILQLRLVSTGGTHRSWPVQVDDDPPPAVATYNPRTASYRLDKVYDNPAYDSNAV